MTAAERYVKKLIITRERKPNPFRVGISEQGLTDRHTTRKRISSGCGEHSDVKQKGGEAAA